MNDEKKTKAQLIAELEELRRQLSKSEEKYFELFAQSPEDIYIIAQDGTVVDFNRQTSIAGHHRDEIIGKNLMGLSTLEDNLEESKAHFMRALKGSLKPFEYSVKNRAGEKIWVEVHPALIHDGEEKFLRITANNITARKQAEEALLQNNKKLEALFDAIPVGISILDQDRNIVWQNKTLLKILDITKEGFESGEYEKRQYIQADGTPMHPDQFASSRVINGEASAVDVVTGIVKEDGSIIWTNVSAIASPFANWRAIVVTSDITGIKQAENALQQHEAALRAILDATKESIFLFDLDGRIVLSNATASRRLGKQTEEVIGNYLSDFIPQETAQMRMERIKEVVSTKTFVEFEDVRDGIYFHHSFYPVMNEQNEVTHVAAYSHNITEQKQSEEALRESKDRYQSIIKNIQDTYIRTDNNGLIVMASPSAARVFGYNSPEEMLGVSASSTYYSLEAQKEIRKQLQAHGRVNDYVCESVKKDGTVFWTSISAQYYYDERGQILGVEGFGRDITERKQAEDRLLDYQHRLEKQNMELRKLSKAIEQSGNTVVITDTKGFVQYANPRFEETTGYTVKEAIGQHTRILSSGEQSREYYRELWRTITHGEVWRGEFHNRRKDGSLYWEAATIAPITDEHEKIVNYIAIKEDITERKRSEILLQESEARFRQIIENASDIIYRADNNCQLTYINPSALHILGYENDAEILGKNCLDIAIPEWRDNLRRIYERQRLQNTQNVYSEFVAQTKSGNHIWLGQNTQIIMEGNQPVGLQAVARDITQIKDAYEALDIARNQALEASQLKSQLLARVSHELRTPLSGVLGYAELLMYNTFGELTSDQKDATQQIVASANYLTNMVEDLLDEAQMTSKSLVLSRDTFVPADVLKKAESTLHVLAANKGLQLITEVSPDLPATLTGDLKRLQQIIINLAGNAIKFTTKGEVRISLLLPKPTHWAIQVADTGAGIPKEAQEYIFEPFRQVNNLITRENRGSGLGLSISKQLVELMGGRITLQSEVGKGSIFTIILPIQK